MRPVDLAACAATSVLFAVLPAYAQSEGADALPAVLRVPLALPVETGAAFAASAGYGYTEDVLHQGDSHNRLTGSVAASARVFPWLAASLRFDGRYDWHHDAQGDDNGWIGEPRLALRAAARVHPAIRLGVQASVWMPSQVVPSIDFDAITPEAVGLFTLAPPGSPFLVAATAGFRLDRSAASARFADHLSASDRLALGVSAFSAVLLGAGASARLGTRVELLADWQWDVLVGTDAPSALASPMHARAGVRVEPWVSHALALTAVVDVSPSERPQLAPGAPLVEVDPRVAAWLLVTLRVPFARPPQPVPTPPRVVAARVVAAPVAPVVTRAAVRGRVLDEAGAPVANARARLQGDGVALDQTTGEDGAYRFDDVPAGSYTLVIAAEGRRESRSAVVVDPRRAPEPLESRLETALPPGQLRGSARAYDGRPVAATVRVEPLGVECATSADGSFQLDVAPGRYTVRVAAAGFRTQERPVVVHENGVTILNVDLQRAGR